ncbi:MAG TPA: hypothetical protein VHP35_16055, partial [Terriglobia bacterium]|nr:hypothetical protein [Terriglobia bacterium]
MSNYWMPVRSFLTAALAGSVVLLGVCLGSEKPSLDRFSNEELLHRAERAFMMRNFLASEKYYRELNARLTTQLAKLHPSEEQA